MKSAEIYVFSLSQNTFPVRYYYQNAFKHMAKRVENMSGTDDDIDGILALFQLYEQKMYHITYAILHDSHLAEDAVMDAFVKMLEHNYRIEDPKSDASKRLVIAVTRSAAIYYDVMFERYVNGKSISETASLLGVSEAAVRKRQERALRILREEI